MHATALQRWARALTVYLDVRVLIVIVLGFSAGLPLALSGSTLLLWMADRGVDLGMIGLFSLAGLPYTLKFLWAPVVDAWQVPWLGARFGRRRGWLMASQILLMAAIVFLGALDPVAAPWWIALAAVLVATASATQDIVIDAFRVESLSDDQQAAGMAGYVAAYRIALLVATAGVIGLVSWLEHRGVASGDVWFIGYCAAAGCILVGLSAVLVADEPQREARDAAGAQQPAMQRLWQTAFAAFSEFLQRPLALAILVFVLLFKFCDALAGLMTGPFVLDLGYDKAAYAGIVKGAGTAAVLAGGFLGGMLARAFSMHTCLWIAGLVQMLSNLLFSWLSTQGIAHGALTATIVVENLAGGVGTVIFVAYLSALCGNPLHTATQFALLTAFAAVGRTVLAANGGFIAGAVGWYGFFIITAVTAVPALALLAWLRLRGHFETARIGENGD